jgi:hypothetical protein
MTPPNGDVGGFSKVKEEEWAAFAAIAGTHAAVLVAVMRFREMDGYLPPAAFLAEHLQVSVESVKSAFKRLRKEGVIWSETRKGRRSIFCQKTLSKPIQNGENLTNQEGRPCPQEGRPCPQEGQIEPHKGAPVPPRGAPVPLYNREIDIGIEKEKNRQAFFDGKKEQLETMATMATDFDPDPVIIASMESATTHGTVVAQPTATLPIAPTHPSAQQGPEQPGLPLGACELEPVQAKAPKRKGRQNGNAAAETADEVGQLHVAWQEAIGRKWILNEKRKKSFESVLLKAGSLEVALDAVRGIALSDHHMGRNETGEVWLEPIYIERHLEKWAEAWRRHQREKSPAQEGPTCAEIQRAVEMAFAQAGNQAGVQCIRAQRDGTMDPLSDTVRARFDQRMLPHGQITWEGHVIPVFVPSLDDFAASPLCDAAAVGVAMDRLSKQFPGNALVQEHALDWAAGIKRDASAAYREAIGLLEKERAKEQKAMEHAEEIEAIFDTTTPCQEGVAA